MQDKLLLIEGVKYIIKFGTKEPFKSAIVANPYNESWTDGFIEDYITKFTGSENHPSLCSSP
jgi:hypothetical protein